MAVPIQEKTYQWAYPVGVRTATQYIILHHAAAKVCSADDIHRWHLDNGWAGIGYHYLVRKDGAVYRGRPENAIGAHTSGRNSASVGVCFEGDYDTEPTMPAAQLAAGRQLIAQLKARYPGAGLDVHRSFGSTACPGRYFPTEALMDAASDPVKREEVCTVELPVLRKGNRSGYVRTLQILLNKYNAAALTEDGDFGSATYTAVQNYQRDRRLGIDGIVGVKTWEQLLK